MSNAATAAEIGVSLSTSRKTVEKLQSSLQAKAKSEPGYRFYSLWDKICREDILGEALRRSRANAGVPGVDGVDFAAIEASGTDQWLGTLQEELRSKRYAPQPLLRVWIPKRNGGRWPLSIPKGEGPRGPDRCGVGARSDLRSGPSPSAIRVPTRYGCEDGRPPSVLAHHAAYPTRGGGR